MDSAFYPLDGDIPIFRAFKWKGHVGVDWVVIPGTNVRSILRGRVIELANNSRTYGRYVIVLHDDGHASLYAHLSKLLVKKGDIVEAGQVIALSGGAKGSDGAGASEGYHLHFEVRPPGHTDYNWWNVDPIAYIESHRITEQAPP